MAGFEVVRYADETILLRVAGGASFTGYEPILKRCYITHDGVTMVVDWDERQVAMRGRPSAVSRWSLILGAGHVV